MLSIENLNDLFVYREDGVLIRNKSVSNVKKGSVAGSLRKDNYFKISINGKNYLLHRVIWAITTGYWPKYDIDHIDGNTQNNRIENLRDVLHKVNSQNRRRKSSNNKSGYIGIRPAESKKNPWQASIGVGERTVYLGVFPTKELAHQKYIEAKRLLHEGNTL